MPSRRHCRLQRCGEGHQWHQSRVVTHIQQLIPGLSIVCCKLTMMTGHRSLAEIEAKLELSEVRYWAAQVSPLYFMTEEEYLRVLGSNSMTAMQDVSRPRTKRSQGGRIEGTARGKSGVKYTVYSWRRQSYSELLGIHHSCT